MRLEEEASERQQLQLASQLAERVASEEAATKTEEAAQQQVIEDELARQRSEDVRLKLDWMIEAGKLKAL